MTIQPSLTVWTVIIFAALYLVLKYLLFKPMLSLMDQREKKILEARSAKENARKKAENERLLMLAERERKRQEMRAEQEKRAEQKRLEEKERLEDAKAEGFRLVEEFRCLAEARFNADMQKADAAIENAAELFLSRLFDN